MTNQLHELTVKNLLLRLNEWRFYPKFQLERHFDVLLSYVLPELLWKYAKETSSQLPAEIKKNLDPLLSSFIIPEFPLLLSLFDPENTSHLANAADFALFIPRATQESIESVLFIELKTDEGSARDSQTRHMHRILMEDKPFSEYLEAIRLMILKSKQNARKYLFLLKQLSNLGLLQGLDEMFLTFQEKEIFYKDKYLKADSISKHSSGVACYSLIIAPGAVVDKIQTDPDLSQLPALSFLQAAHLLELLHRENKISQSSLLLADFLREWDQSPMKKVREFLCLQKVNSP